MPEFRHVAPLMQLNVFVDASKYVRKLLYECACVWEMGLFGFSVVLVGSSGLCVSVDISCNCPLL